MAAAPLGSAAIGAAVSFGTTLYNNEKGFSARHEQCYDFQTGLTQRLVEGFTRAHRDGEVDDEDHEKCISLRDKAIETAKNYNSSISEYKEIPTYNIPSKLKKRKQVRMGKRKLRSVNEDLQSHYCRSLSGCSSDASSVKAESGSPPGSGLERDQIQDWTYGVHSAISPPTSVHDETSDSESSSSPRGGMCVFSSNEKQELSELFKPIDLEEANSSGPTLWFGELGGGQGSGSGYGRGLGHSSTSSRYSNIPCESQSRGSSVHSPHLFSSVPSGLLSLQTVPSTSTSSFHIHEPDRTLSSSLPEHHTDMMVMDTNDYGYGAEDGKDPKTAQTNICPAASGGAIRPQRPHSTGGDGFVDSAPAGQSRYPTNSQHHSRGRSLNLAMGVWDSRVDSSFLIPGDVPDGMPQSFSESSPNPAQSTIQQRSQPNLTHYPCRRERPFRCPKCEKRFSRCDNLRQHLRTHGV